MQFRKPQLVTKSAPASVFAENYDFLLGWALRLTFHDRTAAEDLVQETFVQFVLLQKEVEDPQNAEPLLYSYLKHVHLAELRRSQRHPTQQFSAEAFDSLQLALREQDAAYSIAIQNDLRKIACYLCWRKEATKSASILILRFFHGYFPEEIQQIAQLSRKASDFEIRTAREEVRLYLQAPDRLRVLYRGTPPKIPYFHLPLPPNELMEELINTLFNARRTPCLPPADLLALYQAHKRKPIPCECLAHIVSCSSCLEQVRIFKELPPASGRSCDEIAGFAKRPKPQLQDVKMRNDTDRQRVLAAAERRLRTRLKHRPKALTIAVNGDEIASQEIRSSLNTQRVEIRVAASVRFIEVNSEQNVCLLLVPIEEPLSEFDPEFRREVMLDEGRKIEVLVTSKGTAAVIEVTYRDPQLAELSVQKKPAENCVAETGTVLPQTNAGLLPGLEKYGARDSMAFKPWWMRPFLWIWRTMISDLNPTLATAVVMASAAFLCLLIWTISRPVSLTANSLLVRAEAWDSGAPNVTQGVIRQSISIKTGSHSVQRMVYRDAQGHRRAKSQELTPSEEYLKKRLATAGIDWDQPLSASIYQTWHDHQHIREDRIARADGHMLTLTTTVPASGIVMESITVRESDFHPVQRTVQFKDNERVEIAELDYAVLPWSHVNPDIFEPGQSMIHDSSVYPAVAGIKTPTHLDEEILDLAELETQAALSRLGADNSERIEVERTPSGIEVRGVVENEARKREIEARIDFISHVRSAIYTFAQMDAGITHAQGITSIAASSIVAEPTPLQRYLLARHWSQDAVGHAAQILFDSSMTIERNSLAITALNKRFASNNRLDAAGFSALAELLNHHRSSISTALQQERNVLGEIGVSEASFNSKSNMKDETDSLLSRAEQNRRLCEELLTSNSNSPRKVEDTVSELAASASHIQTLLSTHSASTEAWKSFSISPHKKPEQR
jgi:DNA-directed RNA polymerase specialized sigma24 family protein